MASGGQRDIRSPPLGMVRGDLEGDGPQWDSEGTELRARRQQLRSRTQQHNPYAPPPHPAADARRCGVLIAGAGAR